MGTIAETEFAAIDFESAGAARGQTDCPVQIGIAILRGGKIVDTFSSYLAADRPVTWAARKVHGIRTEDLEGAPTLLDLWPEIDGCLRSRHVVAHGVGTEKRFLRAFPMHGFGPWIDTLRLVRAVRPDLESHALEDAAGAFSLNPAEEVSAFRWHDALSDAVASLCLLRRIITEFSLENRDPEILVNPEVKDYYVWRRERRADR